MVLSSLSFFGACSECQLTLVLAGLLFVFLVRFCLKAPSPRRDHKNNILDPIGGTVIKNVLANLMAKIAIQRETTKSSNSSPAETEAFHPAEDHAFFNESHYYNGCDTRSGNRLITRISRRSNGGKLHYVFLLLDLGEEGIYALEKDNIPVDFTKNFPTACGLSFECIEPMKQWRMTFKGRMTVGCVHPKVLLSESESVKVKYVDVEFELEYKTTSPVFWYMRDDNSSTLAKNLSQEPWGYYFFKSCLSRTKNHGHYEEYGDLTGIIKVNGKSVNAVKAINGKTTSAILSENQKFSFGTFRDHSWDIRRWQTMDQLLILLIEFGRPLEIFGVNCSYLDLTLVNMPGNLGGVQRYSTGYVLPRIDRNKATTLQPFSMSHGTSILDIPYQFRQDGSREPMNKTIVTMVLCNAEKTEECVLEVRMSGVIRRLLYWPDAGDFEVFEDYMDFEIVKLFEGPIGTELNKVKVKELDSVKGYGTRQSGFRVGDFDPTLGGCG